MLSFLDVLVTRVDGTLCTSVYRKPTFSGLFMKYDSFVPIQYKCSLVYGSINRSWKICFSVESFESEVKFLKNILGAYGYLYKFISRQISLNSLNQSRIQIVSYPLAQKRNQYFCYYHSVMITVPNYKNSLIELWVKLHHGPDYKQFLNQVTN